MADAIEARRNPRHHITRPLPIFPAAPEAIPGTMQNVIQGGMLVALPVELELGRTYEMELRDSQGVFIVNGEALRLHLPPRPSDGRQVSESKLGSSLSGAMLRWRSGWLGSWKRRPDFRVKPRAQVPFIHQYSIFVFRLPEQAPRLSFCQSHPCPLSSCQTASPPRPGRTPVPDETPSDSGRRPRPW